MPKRPVIGISSYHRDGEPRIFAMPCTYVDAIRAAGGVPLVFPPGEAEVEPLLDLVGGLVLAGGGDVDPALYGGDPHETVYMVCAERDRFEMELLRAALRRGNLPILCICRGVQVLNVVLGGSLHVHLPDQYGEDVAHRLPPRLPTRHPVRLTPGARLTEILGGDEVDVASWHHQAIDRLGNELEAVAWAADGVVEAVQHVHHPWCFGVQWHPEMQQGEPASDRLFAAFVAAVERSSGAGLGSGQRSTV